MLEVGLRVNHRSVYYSKHRHIQVGKKEIVKNHPMQDDLELALFVLIVFSYICTQVPLIVSFLLLHVAIGILLHEQQQQ